MQVAPDTTSAEARPVWFDAFLVGVGAFLLFALTAQYHDPLNNDTRATALAAWQLAHHGNATLTAFAGHYTWLYQSHGRWVTDRLPGTVFWATPFYRVLGGNAYPSIYPGVLAADTACAIAIALAFSLCCRLVARRIALGAAFLLAFATGTWTVSSNQLWTHGPGQAAVLAVVLLALDRKWLLAGIPAGFAILVRPHLGIVAFVIGAAAAWKTRTWKPFLIGIGCLIGSVVLLAYNYALWKRPEIFGGYDQPVAASGHKFSAALLGIVGDLVSPERGMLVMTPVLLALLPGLRRAWNVAPPWVRSATIAGLAYLAFQLWGIRFGGGDGFYSYRTTLETLTLAVPLLVLAWREWTSLTRLRRTLFAGLAALSVGIHALGALVHWVPSGVNLSPWTRYLPFELARHIGPTQSGFWIAGTAVVIAVATAAAWRITPASSELQQAGTRAPVSAV